MASSGKFTQNQTISLAHMTQLLPSSNKRDGAKIYEIFSHSSYDKIKQKHNNREVQHPPLIILFAIHHTTQQTNPLVSTPFDSLFRSKHSPVCPTASCSNQSSQIKKKTKQAK